MSLFRPPVNAAVRPALDILQDELCDQERKLSHLETKLGLTHGPEVDRCLNIIASCSLVIDLVQMPAARLATNLIQSRSVVEPATPQRNAVQLHNAAGELIAEHVSEVSA